MEPGKITIAINPATNEIAIQSNVPPSDTVLLLARAHQVALNHASQVRSPVQVPDAVAQRALLHGANGANGKR